MRLIDRICEMLSQRGMTKKALCERIGVSPSTFSMWTGQNVTSIPYEFIPAIAAVFGVTCDELLTGNTQIIPDENEQRMLDVFRNLPWDGKQLVLAKLVEEKRYAEREAQEAKLYESY